MHVIGIRISLTPGFLSAQLDRDIVTIDRALILNVTVVPIETV